MHSPNLTPNNPNLIISNSPKTKSNQTKPILIEKRKYISHGGQI